MTELGKLIELLRQVHLEAAAKRETLYVGKVVTGDGLSEWKRVDPDEYDIDALDPDDQEDELYSEVLSVGPDGSVGITEL